MAIDYSREGLLRMDPVTLRAIIRERAHHTVEIQLYQALHEGKPLPANSGAHLRQLLALWEERGLPADYPDLQCARRLLSMAEECMAGRKVDLSQFAWAPYDKQEQETIDRLLKQRRSVRHWTDDEVPGWMIDRVIEAGLDGPTGCNLQSLRFLVVCERHEPGLFRGCDIPGGPVHVVACEDTRVYQAQPGYVANPAMMQINRLLDCGAAMQNMVLMAHALGLGAVWLTFRQDMRDRLRARFALQTEIDIVSFIDLGFPAQTPMPPARITVTEAVLGRI